MKMHKALSVLFLFVTLGIFAQANPPFDSINWNTWSWTAPDQPLEDTWHWFDGTNNAYGPDFPIWYVPTFSLLRQAATLPPVPAQQSKGVAGSSSKTNSSRSVLQTNQGKTEAKGSHLSNLSVSPYGTVSFPGLDGKARTGWGFEAAVDANKTFSIVGFAESDESGDSFFDRAGLGFRVHSTLGKKFHPFAGLLGGYAFDEYRVGPVDAESDPWFLRAQFGTGIDLYKSKDFNFQFVPSVAFDIWTDGGQTDLRLTGALKLSF